MSQGTSVVIPCYNGERYLPEALDSVRAQTVPVREIIVVDDGSMVPVRAPEGWDGPLLRIIRTPNRGPSAARNVGLEHATGEFVAPLDSDDLWAPTKVEEQERALRADPSAVACYTRCVKAPGFFAFGPYPPPDASDDEFLRVLWYHAFFPPSAVMIRRSTLEEVGPFREDLRASEDGEMFFRLLTRGRIIQVARPLCWYRQHPNQFTANIYLKHINGKRARAAMISQHTDRLVCAGLRRDKLWDPYRNDILITYYRRQFDAARLLLWDYWKDHPLDLPVLCRALVAMLPAGLVTRLRGRVPPPDYDAIPEVEADAPDPVWTQALRNIALAPRRQETGRRATELAVSPAGPWPTGQPAAPRAAPDLVARRAGEPGCAGLAVVLVNYNGAADTRKCLDSLRDLDRARCRTIVVDNGSTPDASEELREGYAWAEVVRREDNGGWAGGNNTGIRRALDQGAEWVVLLNNDTIVAPNLIDRLLVAARAHPRFGVLGPIICFVDEPDVIQTDGCRFNPPGFAGFFERVEVPPEPGDPPVVAEVDIINGCCLMAHRRVFETVGLIDERFFLIHEESDFCLRARVAGFACGVLAEPLVWHKGSSTFKRSGSGLQRYHDARNLALLLRKHARIHRSGRGPMASWRAYVRYLRHRYDHEREQGHRAAADAVVEGFCDALMGRYGPRPGAPNRLAPLVRLFFEGGRRVAALKPRSWYRHALSVR